MLREINEFVYSRSPVTLAAFCFFLIVVIGAIDYLTGYELSFSIFYLLPVCFAAWYLGRRFGLFVCLVSAATWLAVDYTSGHTYSHPAMPLWNTGVRLGFFLTVAVLVDRLNSALEIQVALAQVDGLTGLLNGRAFRQRSSIQFDLAARSGRPLALGYIDLDGFKAVNDRLGHATGDKVLAAVAATLATRLRSYDVGARLGGDEFSVLLPDTNLKGARTFFGGLHQSLLELAAREQWSLGFSVGVGVFYSSEVTMEEAIHCADNLMYSVKAGGKNRIEFKEFGKVIDTG